MSKAQLVITAVVLEGRSKTEVSSSTATGGAAALCVWCRGVAGSGRRVGGVQRQSPETFDVGYADAREV